VKQFIKMSEEIAQQIVHLGQLSYLGIFFAVMAAGHIVPIPESITLILIGYVSVSSSLKISLILVFAYLGTMGIDIFMYAISRGGSNFALRIAKKIDPKHLNLYLNTQEKHLFWLVFFSHFVPGWRFANPVILGITKMPWKKFLSYSAISSLIHTPFFIFLGFFLYRDIVPVIRAVKYGGEILLLVVVLVALSILFHVIWEKRKNVYNRDI